MASQSSTTHPNPNPVCERCGVKPACNHLCQIIDHKTTNLALCDDCMREHSAQMGFALPSLDGARCFYCGGVANSAGSNQPWEIASRHQRFHYTCFRCGELCHQFMAEALQKLAPGLSAGEQLRQMERMVKEIDERVRHSIRGNLN